MRIKKSDYIFLTVIVVVIAVFILISGQIKTKRTPKDQTHQPFYEMRQKGIDKIDVDKECPACHDGKTIAFPEGHPAKPGSGVMRCLFCHKLKGQ